MIVKQDPTPGFRPVTITLETGQELDLLVFALNTYLQTYRDESYESGDDAFVERVEVAEYLEAELGKLQ